MTDPRPVPLPDEISAFFWDGAAAGRLLVQRCGRCGKLQYPPDVACVHCQSVDLTPTEVSGRGTLYSYSVVERAFNAGFVDALPYVLALVELEEQPGLRLVTNVVGGGQPRVGAPVEVAFERRGEVTLPVFTLVDA